MPSIKRFDLYRKVPEDLTKPTTPGAIISLLCLFFMMFLLFTEFMSFLQLENSSDMYVQQDEGGKIRLNFNMTFPKLPCFVFSLDVLDIMGRHEVGVSQTLEKTRISPEGLALGILDRNNVADNEASQMKDEGCRVVGYVDVNKVPGNFHISAHGMHHMVARFLGGVTNVNHIIHGFWAGDQALSPTDFPGSLRPLDGTTRDHDSAMTTYEYFLDVIPTVYMNPSNVETKGYQMTAHTHQFATVPSHMPAVYFRYQLSPIMVKFTSSRKKFTHFLTYVCGIVGGVFTVAGLLNSLLQSSVVAFQKNVLGKAN